MWSALVGLVVGHVGRFGRGCSVGRLKTRCAAGRARGALGIVVRGRVHVKNRAAWQGERWESRHEVVRPLGFPACGSARVKNRTPWQTVR